MSRADFDFHSRTRHLFSLGAVFPVLALWIFLSFPFLSESQAAEDKLPFAEPTNWQELPDTALIETNIGAFEITFYRKEAPVSVRNFQYLAENNKYNNVRFHFFQEGFVIQGGDVSGTGKGGPGYSLPPEISKRKHSIGSLSWARPPNEVNLERRSNGSQFFISLGQNKHLNGYYTIFAQVSRGMEVVQHLRKGDFIVRVRLPKGFAEKQTESQPSPVKTSDENSKPHSPTAGVLSEKSNDLPKDGRLSDGDSFALPK